MNQSVLIIGHWGWYTSYIYTAHDLDQYAWLQICIRTYIILHKAGRKVGGGWMDTNMHTYIYHITQSGKEGGWVAGNLLVPSCASAPVPTQHRLRRVPSLPRRVLLLPVWESRMFRHFLIIIFFNILFADVRHLFLCQTVSFGLCGLYCYFLTKSGYSATMKDKKKWTSPFSS